MDPLILAALAAIGVADHLGPKREAAAHPGEGGFRMGAFPALPSQAGPARDDAILALVRARQFVPVTWRGIDVQRDGRRVRIFASSDALMVGSTSPSSAVRASVSHQLAQAIADVLGAVLPTSRMSDVAWLAAEVRVDPQTTPPDAGMGTTQRMAVHDSLVSRAVAAAGGRPGQITRTVGKDWITSERLVEGNGAPARVRDDRMVPVPGTIAGCNYGWQWARATSVGPGGLRVLQPPGLRHPITHSDYSQTLCLYRADCEVDGRQRGVEEVLGSADAHLLSDEVLPGHPCRATRHPALPRMRREIAA